MQTMFIGGAAHGKAMEADQTSPDHQIQLPNSDHRQMYFRQTWLASDGNPTTFYALSGLSGAEIDKLARPLMPK